MSQIISAFYNFFMEFARSGDQYKTRRTKNRSYTIVVLLIGVIGAWTFVKGFSESYVAHAEVVKIKKEMAVVKETNRQLFSDNARLEIRNEILSQTLGMYIGKTMVDKLNTQGKAPEKLPPLDPDTDTMPMPNNK